MVNLANQIEKSRTFFQDKIIRVNLFFSLILNIALWGFLAWQVKDFPELIPLHYNIYFGIDLLGPWYQIFLLPTIGLVIFIINFFLGTIFFLKEKIISYFLAGASSLIQILLLIAGLAIVFLNL